MYVNTRKVGHAFQPMPRPGANPSAGAVGGWRAYDPPTAPLITATRTGETLTQHPPFLMVGCHRNLADEEFRGFAHPGSRFDELAVWTRKLQDNRTHNELLYLTGGFIDSITDC